MPIFPVTRCRLWTRLLTHTPFVRWLRPIVQREVVVRPFSPNQRAMVTMSSARQPAIAAAFCGV